MLRLFFKAIRHKKEHTRRLPSGKVISIRAFDYNDPRTAKPKAGRGKDRATEDLFNPEYSGDLYDPKAVRAARQEAPKPVKAPRLVSARQGPDVSVPDLFAALDNAEKISYLESKASQSGEAKNQPQGEEAIVNDFVVTATGKLSRGKWRYSVIMPDGAELKWASEGHVTHLGVVEMKPGAKGDGKYRIQYRWSSGDEDTRDAWLERARQNEWYANARIVPVALDAGKAKAKPEVRLSDVATPAGYRLSEEGGEILLRGPFNEHLHARLKKLGAHWDGVTGSNRRLWVIPAKAIGKLSDLFRATLDDIEAENNTRRRAEIHRWLGYLEAKANAGYLYERAVEELHGNGIANFPELRARMTAAIEKAREVRRQQETAWAKEREARAAARVTSAAARVAKVSASMLYPISQSPALNRPTRSGNRVIVFTERGKEFRIDENHPSLHGSHLLGHEGDRGAYFYYRPATEAETAALVSQESETYRASERAAQVKQVARQIQSVGDRPAGMHEPVGERYHDTQDIYGGGDWFVVGPEWIWYVRNNGMDGDAWENNNVRTGGAGAIGWRVPYSVELAEKITGTA